MRYDCINTATDKEGKPRNMNKAHTLQVQKQSDLNHSSSIHYTVYSH